MRARVEINLPELDALLDQARREPLSERDYQKLKTALHTLAGLATPTRTTEKTKAVLPETENTSSSEDKTTVKKPRPAGHGRNGAAAFSGAKKVVIPHPSLKTGDACPSCQQGKVYSQQEPKTLVRIVGQAPLSATTYQCERLRCNACGDVFSAPEPTGVGPEKYDESAAAMIAQLKYGSGIPFYRLAKLRTVWVFRCRPRPNGRSRKKRPP
jgi:hypothetical protein